MICPESAFTYLNEIAHFLTAELESGHLTHAYLFDGADGLGKTTMASAFAKAILCESAGHSPCGVCPSCRAFSAQTHPDAITLGLTDGKKSIPVEEVRLLIRDAYIKPFMGTKKVYMIWDAHLMTAQAQNALLKLLEEPPAYVVFLLLCENISAMIPTILSRVRTVRFLPAPAAELKGFLRDKCPEADLDFIVSCAGGSIGNALQIAKDPDLKQLREAAAETFFSLSRRDETKIFDAVRFLEQNKDRVEWILDFWMLLCRDIVYASCGREVYILNTNLIQAIRALSSRVSLKGLCRIEEHIVTMRQMVSRYINLKEAGYYTLLQIWEEIND